MRHEIGQAAGQVMARLEGGNEVSALELRSVLRMSQSMLFLALGWLAREEKIELLYRQRSYWVRARS